jgi:hypothetical protein
LGPVQALTLAQIQFLALATAEEARIKGGAGPVDRDKVSSEPKQVQTVQDYFKSKREMSELLAKKREEQKGLRKAMEARIDRLIQETNRYI